MAMNYNEILEKLIEIVKEAGDRTIHMQEKEYSWGDYDNIDMETEIFLKEQLGPLIPKAGFLTENFISVPSDVANWVIDSIDGNVNFKNRLTYSISVALEVRGQTEVGVVYELPYGILYYARKGKGAFRAFGERIEELHVGTFPATEGIAMIGFSWDKSKMVPFMRTMEGLSDIATDIKRMGPASVDICRVAEGKAKLYLEQDLKEWDYMAGELILKEAGGVVTRYDDYMIFGVVEATTEARRIIRGY